MLGSQLSQPDVHRAEELPHLPSFSPTSGKSIQIKRHLNLTYKYHIGNCPASGVYLM